MAMAFKLDGAKNYKGPEIDLILRLANKPAIFYICYRKHETAITEKKGLSYSGTTICINFIITSVLSAFPIHVAST